MQRTGWYAPRAKVQTHLWRLSVSTVVLIPHHAANSSPLARSFGQGEKMDVIELFANVGEYPYLTHVPQHVIVRAVRALPKVEALALIRGAYNTESDGFASLKQAQEIYHIIMEQAG